MKGYQFFGTYRLSFRERPSEEADIIGTFRGVRKDA